MKRKKILTGGILAGILGISLALFLIFTLPVNTLTLDINPSIQVTTNRLDRVVSIEPLNQDAKELLEDFTLRDKDLDSVINDLTDLMILTGHIAGGQDNMVMITVKDDNVDPQLLNRVNQMIAAYLQNKQIEATIFNQSISYTNAQVKTAEQYDVSPGKMQLIQKLISKDEKLSIDALTSISLRELLAIAEELNMDPDILFNQMVQRIAAQGELSGDVRDDNREENRKQTQTTERKMISRERAKEIALARVNGKIIKFELDEDDGRYSYEFEIINDGIEYEIDIDAYSGEIIKFESERDDDYKSSKKTSQKKQMISSDQAKKIALNKANGKIVKFELDEDDGRYSYEFEIIKDGMEYEIDIDAYSGKIIKFESERDDDYKSSKKTSQKKQMISSDQAKKIALNKVNGKIVEFELDEDDGRLIYEIEIKKDGREYNLEIDAYTGKIIEFEID